MPPMNNPVARLWPLLPKIRDGLVSALGRFPWMLLCGLAGTLSGIESVWHSGDSHMVDVCARAAMTASLGMPLFFSLRMLRERAGLRMAAPMELAGLPLLAAWFLSLPRPVSDEPGIVFIRWGLLLAALHFFVAVSAYVGREPGNGFWQFNRRIFLRFCLATLFTWVLTGGLELALFSADKLFELKIEKSYEYLFFIMAGCFHPLFFLAGVPRDFAALEVDPEYPRGLKAFTQFVLAPLVAAYTAILYAYAFKIGATRAWPHGWVALPVLILSGVGILSALLLHPLRSRPEEKWAGWFSRNFPWALAPLSVLLLLSVWRRIGDYGVTEDRYLGIVAGVWILAWALIFIFKKAAGIRWIPASLAIICLLAAFGPWSAGTISRNNQLRRLTRLLKSHGLIADGKIRAPATNTKLPSKDYQDLRSTIQYLAGVHGREAMRGLFAGLFNNKDWTHLSRWGTAEELFGKLKVVSESGPETAQIWRNLSCHSFPVEGFKRGSIFESLFDSSWKYGKKKSGSIFIGIEDGMLKAASSPDGPSQPVPLDSFLGSLPEGSAEDLPPERMTVDWEHDGRAFRIIFTHVTISRKPGQPTRLNNCSLLLLEK